MPSVLGESGGLMMVMPRTLTFSQRTGLTVQAGELIRVTPSISTFAAVGETNQARARVGKRILMFGAPPGITLPIDCPAPGDGDVFQPAACQQRGIGELFNAFPAVGDDGVVSRVLAAEQGSARVEVQGDVIAEKERPGQVPPSRQVDGTAPARGAGIDGGLQRSCV